MLNRASQAATALSRHNVGLAASLLALPVDYMTGMFARAALRAATAAPVNTSLPTIFGLPQVGQTEVTTTGIWNQPVTAYAYKWQLSPDGVAGWADIPAATSSSYVFQPGDATQFVRSGVLASNGFGPAPAGYSFSLPAGPVIAGGVSAGSITFDWSDPNGFGIGF